MPKIAIISSYGESCGNASFTKVLHDSIEKYSSCDVDVIPINLSLTQSLDKNIRIIGDNHIKLIARQLSEYDAVNIQLEAGLYGAHPDDIVKRVSILMRAHPNVSVTLHSPRILGGHEGGVVAASKKILGGKLKEGARLILKSLQPKSHIWVNRRLVSAAIRSRCSLIVHTKRAASQISTMYNFPDVIVHPLKMIEAKPVSNGSYSQILAKSKLLSRPNVRTIGVFGYISKYKGVYEAIKALELLPSEYVLLLCGRQHPQTLLATNGTLDDYIKAVVDKVASSPSLATRVLFLGELSDDDFVDVCSSVDCTWLPYHENGQDGSGIASIAFDISKNIVASTSFAFDELFKLIPYPNIPRFDVGNYYQLAQMTGFAVESGSIREASCDLGGYSVETQAKAYCQSLGFS
jgi:glycosyltransferase involved in cell wall biosynthesis